MGYPPRIRVILPSFLLLAILSGCAQSPWSDDLIEPEPAATRSLIAEADREHDFGPVIANPGRKIEHRYRLTNVTQQDVKILNVINRKTCCGIVRVEKTTLHPGDTTDVEVTLLVGDRFGEVTHATELVTDLPADSNLILLTAARAVPPIRVEEDSAFERTILIGAKEPRQVSLRVFSSGTAADPPANLDRMELRSTIGVDWASPKEQSSSGDDLRVESRKLTVALDPSGPPGERRAEILIQGDKQVLYRQVVNWEIAPRMTASPKVIAMRPGQRDYRVVIQSRDQTPFQITRIECNEPGIRARPVNAASALIQTVRIEGIPGSKDRRGTLTVFTDHPIQEKVELSIVMIE